MESATTIVRAIGARAIVAAMDGLAGLEAVPSRTILLLRSEKDAELAAGLADGDHRTITIPDVALGPLGQVRLGGIIAVSARLVGPSDGVVFLTGTHGAPVDTLVVTRFDDTYALIQPIEKDVDEHVRQAVLHRVLSLALRIGFHGREGRRVGCLMVLGDTEHVLRQSEQMILNPFKGYDESERNVLDDAMTETIYEYSTIDGAFVIRADGVLERAGARLKASLEEALPAGLGSRHAAAAGITATTDAVAITVSQSDGTVRVWRGGKLVASFESGLR